MQKNDQRLPPYAIGLTLLMAILWGGNSVSIKIAVDGIPPLALAGWRFVLGTGVVAMWALWSKIPLRPNRGERRVLIQLTALFILQIYLLNTGTQHTTAGRSTVFVATHPFFIALFAHLYLPGDRLSIRKVLGMGLSFAGTVLIFSESFFLGDTVYLLGDTLVLGSGILLGARLVYIKRLTQHIEPVRILFWQAILSLPIFFLLSLLYESTFPYRITPMIVGAVMYQGLVIAGFCFILWTTLLKRFAASRMGVFGFVIPISGVMLSSLLLDESVSIALLGSVVLVGAGIGIVNLEN